MNLFLEKLINFILFKLNILYHEIIIFNFLNDKKIFSIIYKNNYWSSKISKSGPGSDLIKYQKIEMNYQRLLKNLK